MTILRFIPDTTNLDFVGIRYWAFAADGLLLVLSLVSIFWLNGFNLGIDFTGGVLLEVKAPQTVDIGKMRAQVGELGFGEAQLQYFTGGECNTPPDSCVLIRVQPKAGQSGEQAVSALKAELGTSLNYRRAEVVGPKVSGELFFNGVLATILAVTMIGVYVAFRFEWQYGIAAAFATAHDVLVTAGLYSILQMDFTLTSVAALLTLAGYSINDTVVIFDRIRENRRKFKRMPLGELINLSTNQTLTRTILTSATTSISIIPLLIWGGPALFDFSAAILFGIFIGTFSSIYVASALLLYMPQPTGAAETKEAAAAAP